MTNTMVELEKFDNMQVIKKERENRRIKNLKPTPPPPPPTISPEKGKTQLVGFEIFYY